MEEEHPEGTWHDEEETQKASFYLACVMWRAIDMVVVSARESMKFLTGYRQDSYQARPAIAVGHT